jgi:3-phosphoshikimate 1-carboxyvinyltransferase
VAGALSRGRFEVRDASELRVKESDRIAAMVANLRALGAEVEEFDDGMVVHGGRRLRGTGLACFGDHRVAMACAVAGLSASGETRIADTACIDTSYPGFCGHLARVMAGGGAADDFERAREAEAVR